VSGSRRSARRPGTAPAGPATRRSADAGVTGIVLAGGRSSRFGGDKLAATIDGTTLLERAIAALAAVADEVVVVAAPDTEPPIPVGLGVPARVVHDPVPFGGPLVGALAGARAARGARVVVAGGDMPALAPAVLRALLAAVEGDVPPAVRAARLEAGDRLQPLPFAASTDAVRLVGAARIAEGDRALRDLLAALGAVALPEASWRPLDPAGGTLRDVDVPADLDAAAPAETQPHPDATRAEDRYPNGGLRFRGWHLAGEMHGPWAFYRADGSLMRAGSFDRGRQVGAWTTYARDGRPVKTTDFGA
jgi:molybdopterin-guanine dinucleotide biosynthesis protein A